MENSVINQEINKIIIQQSNLLSKFKKNSFLITGATGLIGSQIIRILLETNKHKNYKINIYAFCRSRLKAEKIFNQYLGYKYFHIIEGDIRNEIKCNKKIDYIIHGASITQSKEFANQPVKTIQTTIYGTENILLFAKNQKIKKIIYLSTLEVYGNRYSNEKIKENDYGYIDIISPRSSYPESKKMSENMCSSYYFQYGVEVVIARLTQTFGPGVDYNDNRVFAQFARSVIANEDIKLHTKGESIRSYIYIYDAVVALLYLLLYGKSGEAYNVSNDKTAISIYNMAKMLADKNNIKIKIEPPINIEKLGYNPEIKMILDTSKIRKLGWKPYVGIEEMYNKLIESMREEKTRV